MVRKTSAAAMNMNRTNIPLTLLLLGLLACGRLHAETMRLAWTGDRTPACRVLIGKFLDELRTIANDRLIVLESGEPERQNVPAAGSTAAGIATIRCASEADAHSGTTADPGVIAVESAGETMKIRYLGKGVGFDAMDWLPFQQKLLSSENTASLPREIRSLAPSTEGSTPFACAETRRATPEARKVRTNILLSGLIGGTVGAAGGATFSPNPGSSDLNLLVFGLAGAVTGMAFSAIFPASE